MKSVLLLALWLLTWHSAFAQETIRVATEASYPPFEYRDGQGELRGFDIELVEQICDRIDAHCTFYNQPFDSLLPSLRYRRYDMVVAALDVTPERQQLVSFSDSYFVNRAVFVAGKRNLHSLRQLRGKTVGVQNGSTHQAYLLDKWLSRGIIVVPYASYGSALADLQQQKIDAVFADEAALQHWLAQPAAAGFALLGEPIDDSHYFGNGFAIALNRSATGLLQQVNRALAEIKQDGQYKVLLERYFPEMK